MSGMRWLPTYGWVDDPSRIGRMSLPPCPDCSEVVEALNHATRAHYEAEVAPVDAELAFGKAMQACVAGEHRESESEAADPARTTT